MRGRLIQRFVAVLRRLDALETSTVEGGGYDDVFREPVAIDDDSHTGVTTRREMDEETLEVQVHSKAYGSTTLKIAGQEIDADMMLVAHWPDVVAGGFVDTDGKVLIQPGDRIDRIESTDGEVIDTFDNPPGVYVKSTSKAGFGLATFGTARINLLFIYCDYGQLTT